MTLTTARTTAARVGQSADALPALIAFVAVLMVIPSQLIVKPLGAAGTPSQIIGVGLLVWWLVSRLIGASGFRQGNPVKILILLFVLSVIVSYIAGMIRAVAYAEEINSSDRALLSIFGWCGVALVMIDGLATRERLDRLLGVVGMGATFIAVLGIMQFFFHFDVAHYFRFPGLTANSAFGELIARSKFSRVTGTTAHPIEFGVVMSSSLPIVIHKARFAETPKLRRRWWIATAIVAAVLPMSVARSAIIGGAIAVLYLFKTWPPRLKVQASIAGVLGLAATAVVVPGLLGTIKSLFLNAGSDPSTQGRTEDYGPVLSYTAQRPIFGRGVGTFIPSVYRTLDNQYLGTLVEGGLIGLVLLLVLMIGSNCAAGAIRRRSKVESTRNLAQSLKASLAIVIVNAATFDLFGFPMASGLTFLFIGAIGALWALEHRNKVTPPMRREARQAYLGVSAAVLVLVATVGGFAVVNAAPQYRAYGTIVLVSPAEDQTVFSSAARTDYATSVLHDIMESDQLRVTLKREKVPHYELGVGDGSVEMGTDVIGTGGSTIILVTGADNADDANAELTTLLHETSNQLLILQKNGGVDPGAMIQADILAQAPAYAVNGSPIRAELGLIALLVVLATAMGLGYRRRLPPPSYYAADGFSPLSRSPESLEPESVSFVLGGSRAP